ncbi:MAG: ABC transporter ATP-binding protein [Clostridiales bacterium]|nr:ABC transporter ATP-binding protein [Clostridiales bacterium]
MIDVKHLTKRYGNHTAVSDLTFHIGKGQIYGFLGPNGAGKSTTMNIMTGCLAATSGEVKVGGYDIFEDAAQAKRLIGYLPEQPPLYLDRTPREYLTFVGQAKRIPKGELKGQIQRVMETTQITDVADRLMKHLSKGYKQRVGIAQALLGDPEVIILDEPTVGLDPRQIIEIRELITSLGESHTVILSSHILSEVQAICQTIMIISKGRLVACDTPENLEQLFAGKTTVELTLEAEPEEVAPLLEPLEHIRAVELKRATDSRCDVELETDGSEDVCREIFFACSGAAKPILRMATVKASLEDVFIELTSDAPETPVQPEAVSPEEPEQESEPEADVPELTVEPETGEEEAE